MAKTVSKKIPKSNKTKIVKPKILAPKAKKQKVQKAKKTSKKTKIVKVKGPTTVKRPTVSKTNVHILPMVIAYVPSNPVPVAAPAPLNFENEFNKYLRP